MIRSLLALLLVSTQALAGLPPTSTKAVGDSSFVTTFKFEFPNFAVSRSGTTTTFGLLGVAGGGTNIGSYTAGDILYATGSSTLAKLGIGSPGDVLTVSGSNLPSWASGGGGSFVPQTSSTGEADIPSGTTAQRDGTPSNGQTRYNSTTGTMEFYNNGHYFPLELGFDTATNSQDQTSTGAFTFTVPSGVTKMAAIIVGGGGGGGTGVAANPGDCGGGGAGGTVRYVKNIDVIPGTVLSGYVGLGGDGGLSASSDNGKRGQASSFAGFTAAGGAGGQGRQTAGTNGGNGGGKNNTQPNNNGVDYNASQSAASPIANYFMDQTSIGFFLGGNGAGVTDSTMVCGGGGGSNTAGANASAGVSGGAGGDGITINGVKYGCGGGGGSGATGTTGGSAGCASAGAGARDVNAGSATANLGGGGGGSGKTDASNQNGGNGGSGRVILYWYL